MKKAIKIGKTLLCLLIVFVLSFSVSAQTENNDLQELLSGGIFSNSDIQIKADVYNDTYNGIETEEVYPCSVNVVYASPNADEKILEAYSGISFSCLGDLEVETVVYDDITGEMLLNIIYNEQPLVIHEN